MATLAELAKHLDMQVSNLQKLISQGVISKQDKGQYNLDQARSEYIHHFRAINQGRMTKDGLDLQAERARLAKEQADAKEMENAIERAVAFTSDGIIYPSDLPYSVQAFGSRA